MDTSSAKDRTCIFSITLWRWALIVRSVDPSDMAVLIGLAANDKLKDFPLARGQSRDTSANHIQLNLQATRHFMTRHRPLDRVKKVV
jgi:hypothetical protein